MSEPKTIEDLIESCNDPREGYAAGLYAGYEFRKYQGRGAREVMQDALDLIENVSTGADLELIREDCLEVTEKLRRFLR